jgi:glycosyltransferase involved in cell wall biosynthesis
MKSIFGGWQSWSKEEEGNFTASLESNVVFRSGVTDEELCVFITSTCFVYPSLSEALASLCSSHGLWMSIVASRISTFVEAGDAPYYFDPVNKDELIAALEAACLSKDPGAEETIF